MIGTVLTLDEVYEMITIFCLLNYLMKSNSTNFHSPNYIATEGSHLTAHTVIAWVETDIFYQLEACTINFYERFSGFFHQRTHVSYLHQCHKLFTNVYVFLE